MIKEYEKYLKNKSVIIIKNDYDSDSISEYEIKKDIDILND